jgi:hypothetical protein
MMLGKFTYGCAGCQDGYMVQYLVRHRLWRYERLGINGLKSIVFHGPSPTLCVAAGNVWLDHPQSTQTGCIARKDLSHFRAADETNARSQGEGVSPVFDWECFRSPKFGQHCLRFTEVAFNKYLNEA